MQFLKNTKPLLLVMALAIAIFGFYLYKFFTRVKPLPDAYPASEAFILKDIKYGHDTMNYLDLYLPAGRTPASKVLVLIHGGAWVMGDKADFFEDFADYFFENKIIVANINYRLLSPKINCTHQLQDIQRTLQFLKANAQTYKVPQGKYNLLGASAGGHLALLYTHKVDTIGQVSKVISLAGPTNLNSFEFKKLVDEGWGLNQVYTQLLGEEFVLNGAAVKNCSPVYHLKQKPTLLFHALDDDVVPYSQSTQLSDSLRYKQIKHFLFTLPNGKHAPFGLNNSFKGAVQEQVLKWIGEK